MLQKSDSTRRAAPTFIILKKDGLVWSILDFKCLNKCLVESSILFPKQPMYSSKQKVWSGSYHRILIWDIMKDTLIQTDINFSSEKMSILMQDVVYIHTYIQMICYLLALGVLKKHLLQLGNVLQRLYRTGLKINALKSSFFVTEIEYRLLTEEVIKQVQKKNPSSTRSTSINHPEMSTQFPWNVSLLQRHVETTQSYTRFTYRSGGIGKEKTRTE